MIFLTLKMCIFVSVNYRSKALYARINNVENRKSPSNAYLFTINQQLNCNKITSVCLNSDNNFIQYNNPEYFSNNDEGFSILM